MADAMASLSEVEQQAVASHVEALVGLSPAKRAAILTLTDGQ